MIQPRLLALAMLAAAAVVPLGSPATAAPGDTVKANVFLRDHTLPAGGPAVDDDLDFFLSSARAGWANEVTLSVDTSGVTAVAKVVVEAADPGVTCSTTGLVVRCTVPGPHQVIVIPESGSFSLVTSPSVLISLRSKAGAAAGDAGTLSVTAQADDGLPTTETSRLRIGEGVNLTAIDARSRSVRPGGSAALRPAVRNTGARGVRGLNLVVSGESPFAGTNFGNCTYGGTVTCAFETTVAAGRTYRTSAPLTVRTPRDAAAGSRADMYVQWLTRAESQDRQDTFDGLPAGRRGTGPNLTLAPLPPATAAAVPQADIDGDDNGSAFAVIVKGGRKTDIVAVGATITGRPGNTRTVTVGLVNRGPGTLHHPPFSNNQPGVHVTLPAGLLLVRADKRCHVLFTDDPVEPPPPSPSFSGEAVAAGMPPEVVCWPGSVRLRPGRRLTYTFAVKIAPGARAGQGSVAVLMDDDGAVDRNARNNSAPITLDPPAKAGGLPITGTTTVTVAAGGLLLLLAGAAVTTTMRRRKLPAPYRK